MVEERRHPGPVLPPRTPPPAPKDPSACGCIRGPAHDRVPRILAEKMLVGGEAGRVRACLHADVGGADLERIQVAYVVAVHLVRSNQQEQLQTKAGADR